MILGYLQQSFRGHESVAGFTVDGTHDADEFQKVFYTRQMPRNAARRRSIGSTFILLSDVDSLSAGFSDLNGSCKTPTRSGGCSPEQNGGNGSKPPASPISNWSPLTNSAVGRKLSRDSSATWASTYTPG